MHRVVRFAQFLRTFVPRRPRTSFNDPERAGPPSDRPQSFPQLDDLAARTVGGRSKRARRSDGAAGNRPASRSTANHDADKTCGGENGVGGNCTCVQKFTTRACASSALHGREGANLSGELPIGHQPPEACHDRGLVNVETGNTRKDRVDGFLQEPHAGGHPKKNTLSCVLSPLARRQFQVAEGRSGKRDRPEAGPEN